MSEAELKREHKYRYEEYLGNLCVWGTPSAEQHNLAVLAANEAISKLRGEENSFVSKLREFRLSL